MKMWIRPVMVFFILGAGMFFTSPPTRVNLESTFAPLSLSHPLGTDRLGRDIFAMLVWGSFGTVLLSVPARILTLVFASGLSFVTYFLGSSGRILGLMMAKVFLSLPSLLLGLLIVSLFGGNLFSLVLAILLSDWASVYSTLQGNILEWEDTPYTIASYSFGASSFWVFQKHIFPNTWNVIKVQFQTGLPGVIMTLSLFSYLGVNIGNDQFGPGLGEQISFAKDYFDRSPLSVIAPILGISTLVGVLRIK